jgi:hypothetical protein
MIRADMAEEGDMGMGGSVAWTIRQSDGTEHRMQRWTNILADAHWEDGFLHEKKEAVDYALETWRNMAADYEANHATGEFEIDMTPVYAPYPYGLRPSEYGVIVTDFQTKTIISSQHYTSLNVFRGERDVFPEVLEQVINWFDGGPAPTEEWLGAYLTSPRRDEMLDALRDRRIIEIQSYKRGEGKKAFDVRGWAASNILEVIKATRDEGHRSWRMTIDMHGWTVIDIPNGTPQDRRHALAEILRLGFDLDASELNDFEIWIKGEDEEPTT